MLPVKDKGRGGKREMLAVILFVMPSKELWNIKEDWRDWKRVKEREVKTCWY